MSAGPEKAEMLASATSCQLLLIVEQSLKAPGLLDLTRDLAATIHARSGAVVYISCEPLSGRNVFDFIDAQLLLSAPELVARISEEASKVCSSCCGVEASLVLIGLSSAFASSRR